MSYPVPFAARTERERDIVEHARSAAAIAAEHAARHDRDGRVWPSAQFEQVAREISAACDGVGALINSLASEPEMGSPSRGGLPRTTAVRTASGWQISGRK